MLKSFLKFFGFIAKSADDLAVGNLFAVLFNGHCRLICHVSGMEGRILRGIVINGNWDFSLNLDTCEMNWLTPSGPESATGCSVFAGPFMDADSRDYHTQITFVEGWLKRRFASRVVYVTHQNVLNTAGKFKKVVIRFRMACEAFSDSWNGINADPFDDSIPF